MGDTPTRANAFERLMEFIKKNGPYNQRKNIYSNQMSIELLRDLYHSSSTFKTHVDSGNIGYFLNLPVAKPKGEVAIEIDLVAGRLRRTGPYQSSIDGGEDGIRRMANRDVAMMDETRILVENKSILTAHRNRGNRSKELVAVEDVIANKHPQAVLVANVLIGTAREFLNFEVIDRAMKSLTVLCKNLVGGYALQTLIDQIGTNHPDLHKFLENKDVAELLLSHNTAEDPSATLTHMLNKLTLRTDVTGRNYDILIVQFCHVDNIGPPRLVDPPYFQKPEFAHLRYENALKRITELYEERFGR